METYLNDYLNDWISENEGQRFVTKKWERISGGDIHQAFLLKNENDQYFVKVNQSSRRMLFEAEARGLSEMRASGGIRVPEVIGFGEYKRFSFLVLEALHFGQPLKDGWKHKAQQLVSLHQCTGHSFGWEASNFIGHNLQCNEWTDNWAHFFRDQRIAPQLALARQRRISFRRGESLLDAVESLLSEHEPSPSLLHGDLWSGNASFLVNGEPVFFDPACYYGDRETDLAFSQYFNAFPREFYETYQTLWPLNPGYKRRAKLYNLYHTLNHANMFGGSYISSANQTIEELLTERTQKSAPDLGAPR